MDFIYVNLCGVGPNLMKLVTDSCHSPVLKSNKPSMSFHYRQRKVQFITNQSPLPLSPNLPNSNSVSATPDGSPHLPHLPIKFPSISSPTLSIQQIIYVLWGVYQLSLWAFPTLQEEPIKLFSLCSEQHFAYPIISLLLKIALH